MRPIHSSAAAIAAWCTIASTGGFTSARATHEPSQQVTTASLDGPSYVSTATSGDISVPIADNATTSNALTIYAGPSAIVDVNVKIRLSHTYMSDLDIFLVAPDGTTAKLMAEIGGDRDNLGSGALNCSGTPTIFDDKAPTTVEAHLPPIATTVRPQERLSMFNGNYAGGTWTLRIVDDTAQDSGTLLCWQLEVQRRAHPVEIGFTGRSALAVWRPGNPGTILWRTLQQFSSPQSGWAQTGDIPVPGEYGLTNPPGFTAHFRPSTGQWFGAWWDGTVVFGINGDIPVAANYNGDTTNNIAVFRPSEGVWYVRGLDPGAPLATVAVPWGINGDIPVPADYNGDGADDIAIWRPSDGIWYVKDIASVLWGASGDIPVPADYDGDTKADFGIFRPSTGTWHIVSADRETIKTVSWGGQGDIPVPADYDGDGRADIAVWRPANGSWYIRNVGTIFLGASGDIPLTKRPSYPVYPY